MQSNNRRIMKPTGVERHVVCFVVVVLSLLATTTKSTALRSELDLHQDVSLTSINKKALPSQTGHSVDKGYVCGDGKCRCHGTSADCSGQKVSLNYIPILPKGMKFLNFSHNEIRVIDRDDFFRNVSLVTHLDFSHNGLREINSGAFEVFRHLTFLYIGYNKLTYEALAPVLSVNSLQILDISGGGLGNLPDNIFYTYNLHHLVFLYLTDNNLWSVNLTELAPLKSLLHLELGGNELSHGFYSDFMPTLEVLDLEENGLFDFPETCRGNVTLFPRLRQLFLLGNLLKTLPEVVCLPSLELLELSRNLFSVITSDMFGPQLFPNLLSLSLEHTGVHINQIQPYAFRHPKLRDLTLMYDDIDFNNEGGFSSKCFQGAPHLRRLQLSRNYYENVNDTRFHLLLGNLAKLEFLNLESVAFTSISTRTFRGLNSLTHLNLPENGIAWIPDGAFDELENLRSLVLDGNQIFTIREDTFGVVLREQLSVLDLSGNPFSCDCELRWFRKWLVSNPALFENRAWSSYVCENLPHTAVKSFYVSDQSCLFTRSTNDFIISCVSFVIIVLTSFSTFYRYRWHIRLVLYEAFRGRGKRWRQLRDGNFEYDVFVSYAGKDLDWVRAHLLPELEGRMGLRLCIHERDFVPGENIADNIVNSVNASKKIMMLFSPDFVRSHWCQFELNYCLRHVMENDDVLLVVCLHDIPSRDLTPAMMAVLKTTTYIQWRDDADAMEAFWGRIKVALNDVLVTE